MTEISSGGSDTSPWKNSPISVLVLGMAGSGKTSLVQRFSNYLYSKKEPPYLINLDPAVKEVPYPANIGKVCNLIKKFYGFQILFIVLLISS